MHDRWQADISVGTILHMVSASSLLAVGLDNVPEFAVLEESDNAVATSMLTAAVNMTSEMDYYYFFAHSFPHKAMLLTSEQERLCGEVLTSALKEWAAVLAFENEHRDGTLGRMVPLTLSQPYRELMTARDLDWRGCTRSPLNYSSRQ
jgi:hypothetical protein